MTWKAKDPIDPRGRLAEKLIAVGQAKILNDLFVSIPKDGVTAGPLVHREVAFEHAAVRTEQINSR